ncbi:MAG TPA: tRNA (adenosine(37)-N6)-threonylcarbamoyltransferase complex dimerization subunit type 1 TsaB [Pirellulales bacterium]|nr:tRNA (adenosine(37)-N6)-threonylcarbamoyltransferase complex dimerization subunit type 1 TsaB [Pirellulales bacterium]
MKILAIETIGRTGSVAALEGFQLLAERQLEAHRRSAQTLAPSIAALVADVGWATTTVDLVAVANGPGSFTGLRIGVTTAKVFAYAIGCAVQGVPTLTAIAEQVPEQFPQVSVILDAEREELFVGDFQRAPGELPGLRAPVRIVTREQWLASLERGQVVSGPPLEVMGSQLPSGVIAVERSHWSLQAAAVGRVAWRAHSAGERTNLFDLVPQYFRRTAAEERRISS